MKIQDDNARVSDNSTNTINFTWGQKGYLSFSRVQPGRRRRKSTGGSPEVTTCTILLGFNRVLLGSNFHTAFFLVLPRGKK